MKVLKNIYNQIINFIKDIGSKILFWSVVSIPYFLLAYFFVWHNNELKRIPDARIIIIDKSNYKLNLISYKGKQEASYTIALGKKFGDKQEKGDLRTPEGVFQIVSIEDSRAWTYDFEDDTLPEIVGAYGPYFLRIDVPGFEGIGIHGTHDDSSLGTRASQGCIRMNNQELLDLKGVISIGTTIIIVPAIDDVKENNSLKTLRGFNNTLATRIKQ
jgi:hypothetical protein